MQLSHVTAFWLRLAGSILLDLFLYVHMFCSLVARTGLYDVSSFSPLQGRAALTVEVTRPLGRPATPDFEIAVRLAAAIAWPLCQPESSFSSVGFRSVCTGTSAPVTCQNGGQSSLPPASNSGSCSSSNSDAEVLPASSGVDRSQESPFSVTHTTSATPNNAGFAIRSSVRRASGFVIVGDS